ncbi:MAG: c-type cytochrome [Acidobacteriia bacterium]|nr:c-type cytochrome [Terriglobia bacterium]
MSRSSFSRIVCGLLAFCALIALLPSSRVPRAAQNRISPENEGKEFRAAPSPQRLARGRYIVRNIAHCFRCHGEADFQNNLGQPKPGTEGAGYIVKDESFEGEPFPDGLVHPNITPDKETGAGTWSDAQFERAIRHGIGHDGRALSDFMPYAFFRSMTDEDVASVIVCLRSLPPVHNPLPKTKLPFPLKVDFHPEMEPPFPANASEQVKQGWYLVRLAQCNDCHTPADEKSNAKTDMMFGGGFRFTGPWGDIVSPNITSDPSGISHYDAAMFIKTMRTGRASGGVRDLNPFMPFSDYRNMTDEDLKAIFAYLQTVKPVRHQVDNSEPPVYCPLCRQKHGFGDKN